MYHPTPSPAATPSPLAGERAIGIDNFAALVVEEDRYRVVSRAGQPGSVAANGSFVESRSGTPGLWQLAVGERGELVRTLPPAEGAVADLLGSSRYVSAEPALAVARGTEAQCTVELASS